MVDGGDLHEPLGLATRRPGPSRRISSRVLGVGAVVMLSAAGYALAFRLVSDPGRDGSAAVATITTSPQADVPRAAPAAASSPAPATVTDATENGVTIIRPGGAQAPDSLIINVPQALGLQLTPAPDARLVERGRYGALPRIGADGAKPLDVYARPLVTGLPPGAPRIALVVGGMGLSDSLSRTATDTLPGATTLAFAPYGDHLEQSVAAARARGHEVLLQAPMETFEATPLRPHMLRTQTGSDETLDDLHWLMSRFTGYVGIANFLGAKFTADESAFRPFLDDVATRGLFYFDDGTSSRSLAASLAPQVGAPMIRADVSLDGDAIEPALIRLEALARSKGLAVGVANGLPRTVERLARFAQGLEARGISLVPLSAAVSRVSAKPAVMRMP